MASQKQQRRRLLVSVAQNYSAANAGQALLGSTTASSTMKRKLFSKKRTRRQQINLLRLYARQKLRSQQLDAASAKLWKQILISDEKANRLLDKYRDDFEKEVRSLEFRRRYRNSKKEKLYSDQKHKLQIFKHRLMRNKLRVLAREEQVNTLENMMEYQHNQANSINAMKNTVQNAKITTLQNSRQKKINAATNEYSKKRTSQVARAAYLAELARNTGGTNASVAQSLITAATNKRFNRNKNT